ncbi:MAG TPA: aspartate/glutamate racemase family protein [Candidatus Kryptobacter bacterium]|nr:aspartate/glutamate racemase family protein [Candidatus Kryptobacter bacterium]
MKTLGLIGGTGWVSTVEYYRIINQQINERLGGLSSAKILLYSVNQQEFRPATDQVGLQEFADYLIGVAKRLETAGADCLLLCANTPHMAADLVQKTIRIPLIHIADVTAKAILKKKMKTVGLLGTKFTMEQPFYKDRLAKFGITTLVPEESEREYIHRTIMTELEKAILKDETRKKYLEIINGLVRRGAEGIILGCTEIPLLIKQSDCAIPVFDTTELHAMAAVEFALSDEPGRKQLP